ncbi:hypothetical protein AKJ50_00450 [candidate division MSBL1 archaeon SCGC-AAA382A13]|uniref:CBS domain-containing protein n=1 Tax=candidate division MSBL1 archaeon SCGC-AAA382A13 TaxID=1698279 RepID=A0A133VGQ5_9EURY|nr:hypothetical protein AKJ50_00450 [candidate division MSBL1 archaeon SCGC-AAA382A13]
MKDNDFSQLPVKRKGNFVGIVLSKDIGLIDDETPIEKVMKHSVPTIPAQTPRSAVAELLKTNNAALVKEEGGIQGIITPADLL